MPKLKYAWLAPEKSNRQIGHAVQGYPVVKPTPCPEDQEVVTVLILRLGQQGEQILLLECMPRASRVREVYDSQNHFKRLSFLKNDYWSYGWQLVSETGSELVFHRPRVELLRSDSSICI